MIGHDEFCLASQVTDARSEEMSTGEPGDNALLRYMDREGISPKAMLTWAEQRAMRALLICTGRAHLLEPLKRGKPVAIPMDGKRTMTDEKLAAILSAAAIDAFTIGLEAGRQEARKSSTNL